MSFLSSFHLLSCNTQKEQTLAYPLGALFFSLQQKLNNNRHVFIIAADNNEANKIYESLSSLYNNVLYFPAIEVMPFSHGIPSLDILSTRIQVLSLLYQNTQNYLIVCAYQSFIRYLPPVSSYKESLLPLANGQSININNFSQLLKEYGYSQSSIVREIGEFAIKNQLIDIYPSHVEEPIRIIIEQEQIARISYFNKHTQLTTKKIEQINIVPLAEFIFPKDKEGFQDPFHNTLAHSNFIDYYHTLSSLTNYVQNREFDILFTENPEFADNKIRAIFNRLNAGNLLIPSIKESIKGNSSLIIHDQKGEYSSHIKVAGNFSGGFSGFVVELEKLIEENNQLYICFFSEYKENARRIAVMLRRFHPKIINHIDQMTQAGFYIITKNWEFGFFAEDLNNNKRILFIGETDISGKRKVFRKRLQQAIYSNFESDIEPGDAVVHLNYGIGIFKGIERITTLNKEKDYILIEYADQQKLFVPLEQADLIGRYSGGLEQKKVRIDSLSGKSWHKKKIKAKEDIVLFAKQLVESHAKRVTFEGHRFPPDTEEQKIFEDQFKYIETPDQITTIEEIKSDMEKSQPMDRLLCGDVGFGKTEIALRAVFKAIFAGQQTALLAPTTILAEQHYLTCLERFKDFPVKTALITRFISNEERKDILQRLKTQQIDLLVGTHALLSKDIHFKSLGLLIIDEEHKFGVAQKEKIKLRYPHTDILSLSATPIPRTLSLALGNLRAFSTIQTPPELRTPVETIVSDFKDELITDAIRNELNRGGQVYFINNRIKELDKFQDFITKLAPEASIITAHGQMEEEELENAFLGFMRGYYNVLISTTIVESGLDIANANTIIISDSQRLGLSQLYQLKGRVGRGNKQAYAYFLFPEHKNITEQATRRLDALSEYTELGAGFQIAKKDMEIRGAGNILGSEQHGHLIAIGYDMYLRLLRDEVQKLQGVENNSIDTLIDLSYNAYIPDNYIKEASLKMEVYKKIVSLKTHEESEDLKKELRDRYGFFPNEIQTLFEISKLKLEANNIGVLSITEKSSHIEIIFSSNSKADPFRVLEIAKTGEHPVSFNPYNPNQLNYQTFESNAEQKVKRLTGFLRDIQEKNLNSI
ncbi:MAG: transcription-repair coupling factor [Brevinema sp.]